MSIEVDVLSGEVVSDLTSEDARALTEQIATGLGVVWQYVKQAYNGRAWIALGYGSWDDYCTQEFAGSRIQLPRQDRQTVVLSLRDAGLSIRAIAAATGIGTKTVQRDLAAGVVNDHTSEKAEQEGPADLGLAPPAAPADDDDVQPRFKTSPSKASKPPTKSVTGTDGKQYPATPAKPAEPRRPPLLDQAKSAGWDLNRAIERLEKVAADDRYPANKPQVAVQIHGHLTNAIRVCQDLLDGLDNGPTEAQ